MAFNIAAACSFAASNALPRSVKRCARYVRKALEAGGLNTSGRPEGANQYKYYLPTIGFKHIATLTGREQQAQWSSINAQNGDLSVMDHGRYGHICMWIKNHWVSDFVQNNMWPYSNPYNGTCYIFRYTGEISNADFNIADFGITGISGGNNAVDYNHLEFNKENPGLTLTKNLENLRQDAIGFCFDGLAIDFNNLTDSLGGNILYRSDD